VLAAPNVVLILTDDQRDDISAMPRVQALAAEGVAFRQSFVTTSLCAPSRASLLTGQYAHHTHVLDNRPANGGVSTFDPSVTLATARKARAMRPATSGNT
jgi:arylsulfatase A-like enzyme